MYIKKFNENDNYSDLQFPGDHYSYHLTELRGKNKC